MKIDQATAYGSAPHRLLAMLLALAICLCWHHPAKASSDFECTPAWKLAHDTLSTCDNMAMLGPGNDTRVNLLLLLADHHPGTTDRPSAAPHHDNSQPDDPMFDWATLEQRLFSPPIGVDGSFAYASGEGSRCLSNQAGQQDFTDAVKAEGKIPDGEQTILIDARAALVPSCVEKPAPVTAIADADGHVKSPAGRAFLLYLQGAEAFYAGDFDRASARFTGLANARSPWLRETARYMIGRVEVNRMQVGLFDEYGYPKGLGHIAPEVIDRTRAALDDYLRAFPRGIYAISARGLMRRVYWLGGMTGKLASEYAALFAQDPKDREPDNPALAEEIDNKLLPGLKRADVTDPLLLAVMDLAAMRTPALGDTPALTLAELEAQRPAFAAQGALFDYLLAVHAFYIEKQPETVLRLIPDAARQAQFSYVEFSRQTLRGMALEAGGDRNARGFWMQMLTGATAPFQRPAIELAIAWHDERAGALAGLFDTDSPVRNPSIRAILLTNVADASLLRRQARSPDASAHERDLALFTLLYKDATRGPHSAFAGDLALVPAGASAKGSLYDLSSDIPLGIFLTPPSLGDYDCPSLRETEGRIAAQPDDAKARLCLADFMRVNGFDHFFLDRQPSKDELGGTPSLFAGRAYSRQDSYEAVIADPKASPSDKAYALFRAINCYAPSGNNDCGGSDVPKARRKAWFQQLKINYPSSQWARELTYYW